MALRITIEIISFLFVLLFLYAAFSKLVDYETFTIQINQSPLLTGLGGIVPWLVIGIEIIVSGLLLLSKTRILGFYLSYCLMMSFTVYIIVILNFSPYTPCSCGGVLQQLGWAQHLIFNASFLLLALIGIFLESIHRSSTKHIMPN